MFPGIYGFAWDAGHVVFLGAFYLVVTAIAVTLAAAAARTLRAFTLGRGEAIGWAADFHELPASARRCRHELNGEVASRTCDNAFECRNCAEHARLTVGGAAVAPPPQGSGEVGGFALPADRLYHRGHTWVRPAGDGVVEVGLDDLGRRLLGDPEEVRLPEVGARVSAGGAAWHAVKRGAPARVLSPVDGTVVAVGGPGEPFYLRVRLDEAGAGNGHLLGGREARAWMLREAERLQVSLSVPEVGAALADGGTPLDDLSAVIAPERLDTVLGDVFLDP